MLDEFAGENVRPDQWDIKGLEEKLIGQFGLSLSAAGIDPQQVARHELGEEIFDRLKEQYEAKEKILGAATMRYHERMVMLSVIDGLWKEHLLAMDHLKEGIGLRGYAQQDPLVAYKKESFDMFEAMMAKFQEDTVRFLFRMQILGPDGQPVGAPRRGRAAPCRPLLRWPAPRSPSRRRRRRAARNRDPRRQPSTTIDAARKGVPPQEAARTGSRHPRRRRRSSAAQPAPHRRESRPQRSLPLRLRQEIQEMPRRRKIGRGRLPEWSIRR